MIDGRAGEMDVPFDVLVIGAGVAGTGAALAAARGGARVAILNGGTGASTLAGGALDWFADDARSAAVSASPIAAGAAAALEALGTYVVPDRAPTVLTMAGVARSARGHDRALLNLTPIAGRVGVVACRRPGWDAAALAGGWSETANRGSGAFEPLAGTIVRHTDESAIPDADFAARHDDDARLRWLAERLREALSRGSGKWDALALPPMLGLNAPCAEALSRLVGLPCGEAIARPGGPAGLRFEHARDRALAAARVSAVSARAHAIDRLAESWRVTGENAESFEARAVVVATGGLIGGGLEYAPSDAMFASALPPIARPPIRLTLRAPFVLGVHGRPFDLPGSLFGRPPEGLFRLGSRDSLLDCAGVLTTRDANGEATGASLECRLFAAGDIVADEPRTWLGALASGARAGERAALRPSSATETPAATAYSSPPSLDEGPASQP